MLGISARRSIDETLGKHKGINMSTARRWQTPPPPSPCILQLPKPRDRRLSKRSTNSNNSSLAEQRGQVEAKARGKLVALFGEEREFARSVATTTVVLHPHPHSPRRPKVLLHHDILEVESSEGAERWDWKFEAEVVRAECNLLRMEKEVAVRRWEEASRQMQHALTMAHSLHSALQTLVTGRKKIVDDKTAQLVLQTTLENQIEALQSKSELSIRQTDLYNFDQQAPSLRRRAFKSRSSPQSIQATAKSQAPQHRLQNLVLPSAASAYSTESDGEENPKLGMREGKDDAEIKTKRCSPSFLGDQPNRLGDAALLKKRLDSLSMGMKESRVAAAQIRMEYKHMLSRSGDCSSRRWDAPERTQGGSEEKELCCQLCKATIRKIAAQVQAETEQWSQVQEILHHVREEMEELHKSRDFWEDRALKADAKIATLRAEMHEWREKAHTYSNDVSELQSEMERVRQRHALEQSRWLCLHSDSKSKHMPIRASKFMLNPPPAEQRLSFSGKRIQLKHKLAPQTRENEPPKSPRPLVDIGNTNANSSQAIT